jgi:hypothetical protein
MKVLSQHVPASVADVTGTEHLQNTSPDQYQYTNYLINYKDRFQLMEGWKDG